MKNLKYLYNILSFLVIATLFSCEEKMVETYLGERAVIFISSNGEYYSNYIKSYDFTDMYPWLDSLGQVRIPEISDSVSIRIQGYPITEGEDAAIVHLYVDTTTIIDPGVDTLTSFDLNIDTPIVEIGYGDLVKYVHFTIPNCDYGSWGVNLAIDYDKSTVIAGSTERRQFQINANQDFRLDWEELGITEQEWIDNLQYQFGEPTPAKIRFLIFNETLAGAFSDGLPSYLDYWTTQEEWLLKKTINQTIAPAIKSYNTSLVKAYGDASATLCDEDGNIITFTYVAK